jgi:hypothetical protein
MPRQSAPTEEEIRRVADALFQGRDYLFVREELPTRGWIDRALGLWFDLMEWVNALRSNSPLGWIALMLLLCGILALLIWHIVWTIRRAGRWQSVADPTSLAAAEDPAGALRRWLAEAERDGDRVAALRVRFQLLLTRERVLHPGRMRRGWTNRECVRLFRDDPPRATAMLEVVAVLDRTWYGRAACSEPEFLRARHLLKDVLGAD